MAVRIFNISLALGWNERYDHKVAIGIIKFARQRPDWRLFGYDWMFQTRKSETQKPDGVIARITSHEDLRRLRAHRVPIVDIADIAHDSGVALAMNDDPLTGRMAAAHLLDKGFSHLAYVGFEGYAWSDRRVRGVRELLAERDGPELSFFGVKGSWLRRQHSLSGLARWLARLPQPCGVIAANDLVGYRVTLAAALAGLPVPERLGVIGVDNEDVYCELAQPSLTSIGCDCERIGMEAANLLAQILNDEDPLRHVVVPPLGIFARESTNVAFGPDRLIRDVRNFIRANVGRGINVADVSEAFPLSRRALEKRFRQATGSTLHEQIMETRLGKARELLLAGRLAAEAGHESGFRTVQHFYHAFKAHTGMTPLEYVAQHEKH